MPDTTDLSVLVAALVPPVSAVLMVLRPGERGHPEIPASPGDPRRRRTAVLGGSVGLLGDVLSGGFGVLTYVSAAFGDATSAGDVALTLAYLAIGAVCFSAGPGLVAVAQHSRLWVVGILATTYLAVTATLSLLGGS